MKFDIISIFPELVKFYSESSILKKAQEKKKIEIKIHNLRDFIKDKHRTVDDKPFGGGRGMIVKVEPIFRAVSILKSKRTFRDVQQGRTLRGAQLDKYQISKIKYQKYISNIKNTNDPSGCPAGQQKSKIILFTPRGKKFNQKMAYRFSKLDHLIMICGRYEGIDERVAKYIADEQISVGDYVLMGGELPALMVMEAVARLLPGVIGKSELLSERISKTKGFIEYPQYTRPEIFEPAKILAEMGYRTQEIKEKTKWRVPPVLLSGNHQQIKKWREKKQKIIS